jgi:dolichol kinase
MSVLNRVSSESRNRQAISMASTDVVGAVNVPSLSEPSHWRGEFLRKTLHMLPGLAPFGFFLTPHHGTLSWDSLILVAMVTVVLTLIFIGFRKIVGRPGETDFYATCISYPLCVLATVFLFPNHPEFACVVVVVIALGDGSAYIGGKLFGGARLPWNPNKTWAGTITFVVVAAPIASLVYWMDANREALAPWGDGGPITVPLAMALICGVVATLIAAVVESWQSKITDNLRVGVAALASIVAVHYLCAALFLA